MENNQNNQKKSKNLHKALWILALYRLIFRYLGVIFPSLIGRWAYYLWFQTHRSPRPKREQDWLRSVTRSETIDINGLPVMTYYWENSHAKNAANKNTPLVMLVHGWTGRGSQMGAFAEPLLKAGFSVLSFDNQSHGQTPGKASSIFKLSEIQIALSEKISPLYGSVYGIIAHSFGGMVTAYSLSQGLKTKKVVCISSPSRFEFLLDRFSRSLHIADKVRQYMLKRFEEDYGDDLAERVSATTTSKQLGHIPVLIIHDEDDKDVLISESELMHQAWPNSVMQRTKGLQHRRILHDPQVIENVVNFLK